MFVSALAVSCSGTHNVPAEAGLRAGPILLATADMLDDSAMDDPDTLSFGGVVSGTTTGATTSIKRSEPTQTQMSTSRHSDEDAGATSEEDAAASEASGEQVRYYCVS